MALGKLTKVEVEASPSVVAELREMFWGVGKGDPSIAGYYDARGKLRRIVAKYVDGWRHQINLDAEGYITSRRSDLKLGGGLNG